VGVALDARIGLRFSRPIPMTLANRDTIRLKGPGGEVSVRVVPAERGMLVFATPEEHLLPGSSYELSIGGNAREGQLPHVKTSFSTKSSAEGDGEDWTPSEGNFHGDWRSG